MRDTATLSKIELTEDKRDKAVLNALFRCDKCSAQAYVRTTLNSGNPLYWCSHHANQYELALLPYVREWYTEEVRLQEERHKGSEN
jgi:hypothetical protein